MPSDQPITQWLNSEQVDLLRPWFVDRNEPNYAWQHACSAVMALPGLRAFWPMSSVDYTVASRARDVAGGGYHLSDNNTVTFGYDQLAPYAEFDGVNQYLSRADGGAANWADITGTEAYVVAAQRGLTLGGWFRWDIAAAGFQQLIGKSTAATQYMIYVNTTSLNTVRFRISDGVTFPEVVCGGINYTTQVWQHYVGRYDAATQNITGFLNGIPNTSATLVAAIRDTASDFTIGAASGGIRFWDGKASLCFACAAALSDAIIGALYQSTRKLYGV